MKNTRPTSKLFVAIILTFTAVLSKAESVIDNPSRRVINLPIGIENGEPVLRWPSRPSTKPRLVAACRLPDLNVEVRKQFGQKRAVIQQTKDGVTSERVIPYVMVQKLTKDMLGQYAAAVVVAQQLGITEVDYVKIFLVDPQIDLKESKALVFFYDTDDDIIERTLVSGNMWERCEEE
jgi:hypothetical protein